MCGIAGVFNFRSLEPVDRGVLATMTDLLRHRGPDDQGFYVENQLGLGMRRLSIIDLHHGAQPIGNEDGSIQIVFNGEIYNHKDLRESLTAHGHRFRTRADTEVIVHAYEEFGLEFLDHLNGMFGLALWDSREERLVLARDRFGIKPLYYAETRAGITFGSEIKALLACPNIPRDLDPVALTQYFSWGFIPAPRTPFRSIRKLGPATVLVSDPKGVRSSIYWRLQDQPPIENLPEAEEGLRWHLERAVRLQMEADVPVGAFLSGGVDSSAVVSILSKLRGDTVHTFSIGFPDESFDESQHARRVARVLSTRHEEEVFSPRCLDLLLEVSGTLDEPFADDAILPTYQLAKLARQKVKVVLSGDGGDEVFGGYDHYKAHRLVSAYSRLPGTLRRRFRGWIEVGNEGEAKKHSGILRRLRRMEEVLDYPAPLEHTRWLVRETRFLDPEVSSPKEWRGEDPWAQPVMEAFRRSTFGVGVNRQMEVDLGTFLADGMLFKTDRATMAASLEARVPYLDHELVEFAFRIPEKWKLNGLRGKWILRRAFRGHLPGRILRRRKSGFDVPVNAWLRGDLKQMTVDLLSSTRLRQQGIFRPNIVGELLEEHLTRKRNHGRVLWGLLMFELWRDRFCRPCGSSGDVPGLGVSVG